MLLEFQRKHTTPILKYLLVKAGQWTSISEEMLNNASENLKKTQVRRLINSLTNSFDSESTEDRIMLDLMHQEQEHMLEGIMGVFSKSQMVELLLSYLDSETISSLS